MADKIKGVFVKDDALHIVCGSEVWSVKDNGKEPNQWPKVHFANVGTSEEFVDLFSGECLELVDGSAIFGDERKAVKDAIMTTLIEGLMPAFEHLRKIRQSISTPLPELNRRQLYEDFARVLWHAYKDLMPKVALLLGFDIGFQFKGDAAFENGIAEFNRKYPSLIMDIPGVLKRQRLNWQQGLSEFRNDFLEHRKRKDIAAFERATTGQRRRKCFSIMLGVRWRTCSLSSSKPASRLRCRLKKFRWPSATLSAHVAFSSFCASRLNARDVPQRVLCAT
jgi:hypothetical protein